MKSYFFYYYFNLSELFLVGLTNSAENWRQVHLVGRRRIVSKSAECSLKRAPKRGQVVLDTSAQRNDKRKVSEHKNNTSVVHEGIVEKLCKHNQHQTERQQQGAKTEL